jgi:hypothetical protein
MAGGTKAQSQWLLRVLGVDVGTLAGTIGIDAGPTALVWNDAKETVDQQLNSLYGLLKKTGLPVLNEVANEIESVLGKYRVALTTALMTYDGASEKTRDAARVSALKAIAVYKQLLPADKHVIAADTNPFRVPVTIRATLGKALDTLASRLETV